MVPAENLLCKGYGYGSCGGGGGSYTAPAPAPVTNCNKSMMDQEESITNSSKEAGLSSKDDDNITTNPKTDTNTSLGFDQQERDKEWLRLSIGGQKHDQVDPVDRKGQLVELDLFSSGPTTSQQQQHHETRHVYDANSCYGSSSSVFGNNNQREISNFGFRSDLVPQNITSVSSSSMTLMPLIRPYFGPPSSSFDIKIIDPPPRRPSSGLWFALQASQNQVIEPFLPQIAKSYLRIKDGRITVRLVMKYLRNKLQLDSESEIEIRCRGQQLVPYLTLQHVRDTIWRSQTQNQPQTQTQMDYYSLLPNSTTDHVMLLLYASTASKV